VSESRGLVIFFVCNPDNSGNFDFSSELFGSDSNFSDHFHRINPSQAYESCYCNDPGR